ncbi:MAG: BRCT domain-containing protein [Gammaproteobacteria bacterium]|nr:BRCT domain-containing protein [Gammaproteobacteria bacterium]MBU1490866.1 BRCT domain-containing protein [Gammaproteobacteria bacterium]MBU2067552.1 BRCT domain-containing protein [Gammaproteobacteria bacterium]MBU2139638.1 BRCT domain-containing protein [Gammaproteobacteria bacterium]MBU2215253.1 BRCT domain-containing protein [Gammaproteobacteria bacterium]
MDLHREFKNSRFFNAQRMDRRAADALAGLAAGITADGLVTLDEAQFLQRWLEANLVHLDDPVINLLYQRLQLMLADGVLDPDESADLLSILMKFGGLELAKATPGRAYAGANDLPLNAPVPNLEWDGRLFVFTGTMAYGPRKECQKLVEERGGIIGSGVSKKIHYLVIGSIGNEQWRHSSYGLKIMKAVELRDAGTPIAIVGENAWQQAMFG